MARTDIPLPPAYVEQLMLEAEERAEAREALREALEASRRGEASWSIVQTDHGFHLEVTYRRGTIDAIVKAGPLDGTVVV